MTILLAYASRSRPDIFRRRYFNWRDTASNQHRLEWSCEFDEDDSTMNTDEMLAFIHEHGIHARYGKSQSKIEAINASATVYQGDYDILITVSDDMVASKDWDSAVVEAFGGNLNQALWFPDGRQTKTCTLVVEGRPIYEAIGYIYHPDFVSVYADNHWQDTLSRQAKLKFVRKSVFRHEWPGKGADALMRRNEDERLWAADRKTYERLLCA